jgi:adenylosuccinate lyase
MVPRYTRPEMAAIWAPENRYRIWFEIEALAAEGMAAVGAIPADAARTIRERGTPMLAAMGPADVDRIDAIERETRHDVIAFLTWLAEGVGPDSRFVHLGMTSSDVLDTCLAVQLTQATDLLIADVDAVLAALKDQAFAHKHTLTIGRRRRSPPAPSPAPSAPMRISIRGLRITSRPASGSPPSRSRPR